MTEAPRVVTAHRNQYVTSARPAEGETWPDFEFSDWRGRRKVIRPARISFVLVAPGDTYYSSEPAPDWLITGIVLAGYGVLASGHLGRRRASAGFGTKIGDTPGWAWKIIMDEVSRIKKEHTS